MDALLDMWANLLGLDCPLDQDQLKHRLLARPPTFTNTTMDCLVASEPALWSWRKVGMGRIKIVASWANRPTRPQWRELRRYISEEIIPCGVQVEFRGCPHVAS